MSRRTKWLAVAAAIFAVVNVGGAIFAAWQNEFQHAGVHVALALLSVYGTMLLSRRRNAATDANDATSANASEVSDRLSNLERSIDVVAIEVERVGEGQRFMTELLSKKAPPKDETEARR